MKGSEALKEMKNKSIKSIRSMEIEPAENGGHTVTHRYKGMPHHSSTMGMSMAYQEPESHVFGANEGHEMLAHIANHLAIPEEHEMEEPEAEDKEEIEVA